MRQLEHDAVTTTTTTARPPSRFLSGRPEHPCPSLFFVCPGES
jgi:hypothetical protein